MITIGYMPRTLQQSQLVTCCNTIDVARTGLPSITSLTVYQTETLKKLLWEQKVWFHHVSIAIDSQVVIWICWSTLVPFAQNIYTTHFSGSWVTCTVTSPCEISKGSFGPDLFGISPRCVKTWTVMAMTPPTTQAHLVNDAIRDAGQNVMRHVIPIGLFTVFHNDFLLEKHMF